VAVEKSYARLGFFLVVALVVVLATALLFIQRLRRQAVIEVVTYIPEDVGGLDVSSPVRYRGVSVGRVTEVRVDPREVTIEVDFELFLDRLHTIGANVERIRQIADIGGIAPRLRARVVGNPVTGEAYLLLDVPKNPPPPIALGFKPERPYIASMPSPLATVQDRLPAVLERAEATLRILGEIVSRIPGSLDRSDRFFTNVEGIIKKSELPALSADSRKFFTTTSAQIEQITSELEGVIGPEGKLVTFVDEARAAIKAADLPATNQSTRAAADKVTLAADDIRRSLPAIRDSLEQLRQLARQLEEQPESVVFGPRPPVKP
jgi:phospholipid/cholesterol/gamma-HCH transport system substrate-binding protein